MNATNQRICAHSVLIFLALLFGGLMIAGFLPPTDPALNAEQVKQIIVDHQTQVRIGLLLALIGTCFCGPFVAVISVQLKRIEGARSPFAYAQLILGLMNSILLLIPLSWLMTASYRTERPAEAIQALSDQAWMIIAGGFYGVLVQFTCIGIIIMRDPRERPVYPRWLGYLSFWGAIGSFPAVGLYFVTTGPFAWNNLLGWWVPVTAFGTWAIGMYVMTLRAITEEERNPDPAPDLDQIVRRVLDALDARSHGLG